MSKRKWIVVNIGCIECCVSSKIVAVVTDKAYAERIAAACDEKYRWREDGQNAFEVFELPALGVIDSEYSDLDEF